MKDISFNVKEGEKISIIGESGSGKTSILKVIDGQFDYNGEVLFNSNTLKKRSETLIYGHVEIKLIDQHFDLHKNITVLL